MTNTMKNRKLLTIDCYEIRRYFNTFEIWTTEGVWFGRSPSVKDVISRLHLNPIQADALRKTCQPTPDCDHVVSVITADGQGAYCQSCGETLA